ncbi:MAG: MFS transporter [Verrucomicrobia bacterium]|nr:MFS transporter [Verrucomicrobiota bacterium]
MKNRSLWLGLIGNVLEHYDAALFGLLAPFLAPLFFPTDSPVVSLALTYALLPMGFLSKPLGAFLFGWFGDRFGRRRALSISLFGMAISTGMIGFLPTYDQAGVWAPILLAVTRGCQSLFAVGETTGGALFVLEKVSEGRRTIASSLFDASGILGILLGSYLVSHWNIDWRLLFWVGASAGLVGAVLRLDKDSEPEIKSLELPFKILWKQWKPILGIAFVSGFSYFNYYLITTFMNGFLPLISSITREEALELNTGLLCFDLAALPFFGWLARKIPKERLMGGAIMAILVLSVPLFGLLEGASYWTAAGVRLTFTLFGVALAAPFYAWAFEKAPENHRFLICAVGSAIGSRMLGSPAPVIGLSLYEWTGWVPASILPLWILGIGSLCFLTLFSWKKLERIMRKSV